MHPLAVQISTGSFRHVIAAQTQLRMLRDGEMLGFGVLLKEFDREEDTQSSSLDASGEKNKLHVCLNALAGAGKWTLAGRQSYSECQK